MKRRIALILTCLLLAAVGWRLLWLRGIPDQAARLIAGRKLAEARNLLNTYLTWHRTDSRARLLLAEALGLDDTSPKAVHDSLKQLGQIPDSAPEGAVARFRQGQLQFLIQHRPAAGEKLLRHSLRLNPDFLPAHTLLWKLLEATGRQSVSAPVFWKVYDLSNPADRPLRLREWYLSEFSPGSANAELDRNWGVLAEGELPNSAAELRRYELFIRDEPESALGHAAAAMWCVGNRELEPAERFLSAADKLPTAWSEPLFVAGVIALRLEQGRFDEAAAALDRWPQPRADYDYFKFQGTILDEVRRDIPAAVRAYQAALAADTGDAEWTTQNRLAHCLQKLGKPDHAATVQKQAKIVEQFMESPVHRRIRTGLVNLRDPQGLQPILELYEGLGRQREVRAWKKVIAALQPTRSDDS